MAPYTDFLPFFAGPGPVGEDMDDGLIPPPSLVVPPVVLGKTTDVHDPKVGIDAGPSIRGGLPLIVEAGPHESAGHPRALRNCLPRFFGGVAPAWLVQIVGADIARLVVICIFTTGANGACGLRGGKGKVGELRADRVVLADRV